MVQGQEAEPWPKSRDWVLASRPELDVDLYWLLTHLVGGTDWLDTRIETILPLHLQSRQNILKIIIYRHIL